MRKLIIGAILMVLPALMFGQESREQSLARGARERAEAERTRRIAYEWLAEFCRPPKPVIVKHLWPPEPPVWLEQRYETQRTLEDMKRGLHWEAIRLQFRMEEELRQTLRIEHLFRNIYRPRSSYRNPWIFGTEPYYNYLRMWLSFHPDGDEL